jgi:hypothetical protein
VIKSGRMRWARIVARMGERRGACRIVVGRPERKRPLVRPRHTCEDNIKINSVSGVEGVDWIDLV